ncbi:MAG: hypothetical protein D6737_00015 [Chloroflexi bacterium]|nr:MAG: hypothetical protein D6737_00015 [Chloroflexota bacterium]
MIALGNQQVDGFSTREQIAIAFATELTINPSSLTVAEEPLAVSEKTQTALKTHFSNVEIVELASAIMAFNFMNRFNRFFNPDIDVEMPPDEIMALIS